MTAITRPFAWAGGLFATDTRLTQDRSAILLGQDPPCCIIRRAATQSFASGGFGDVSWDTEDRDNDGLFPGTGTTITIVHDGDYMIDGVAVWQSNTTAARAHLVKINGTQVDSLSSEENTPASGPGKFRFGGTVPLVTGNTIVVTCWQNSGASLTLTARLTVVRITGPGS